MKKTHMALMAESALRGYLGPKMAADSKIDLKSIVTGVTAKTWKQDKPKIKIALDSAFKATGTKAVLAKDADISDVTQMLDALDDVAEEVATTMETDPAKPAADTVKLDKNGNPIATDDDGDMVERLKEVLKAKGMSDEDIEAVCAAMKPEVTPPPAAKDTTPPGIKPGEEDKDKDKNMKPAMDAAIREGVKLGLAGVTASVTEAVTKRLTDIAEARAAVKPYIGELAMDAKLGADDIYKKALTANGVKVDGVHPSAFPTLLSMVPKPGDRRQHSGHQPKVAMDAAQTSEFESRYPQAKRARVLG